MAEIVILLKDFYDFPEIFDWLFENVKDYYWYTEKRSVKRGTPCLKGVSARRWRQIFKECEYLDEINEITSGIFRFTRKQDALLFKLMWS